MGREELELFFFGRNDGKKLESCCLVLAAAVEQVSKRLHATGSCYCFPYVLTL